MQRIGMFLGASARIAVLLCGAFPASAQIAPDLGDADGFAVLGGSAVTNTGGTVVTRSLGVWPSDTVTGFPPGVVVDGTIHLADAVAQAAQSSVTAAYLDLESQGCPAVNDLTGTNLGGLTLTEGVYCFDSSAQLTGTLTLDAQGDPNAVFIFQIASSLTTASGSSVLINGASECNVFWQVGSSATLGTTTSFMGSTLALTSITLNTGASVAGRTLARNGAVTLDTNSVDASACALEPPPVCPPITVLPETLPDATVGEPYNETITATGGTAPYTFTLSAGALPDGLTLTSAGELSGTPTTAGDFTFTILATDAKGCFADRTYTMSVFDSMPTLPQLFVLLLALGLTAVGYFRLRQARAA